MILKHRAKLLKKFINQQICIHTHRYIDMYVYINADIHIYSEDQRNTQKKVM